jgi:hypothetical protein
MEETKVGRSAAFNPAFIQSPIPNPVPGASCLQVESANEL